MTSSTTAPHDSSQPHDTHASIRAAFASSSSSSSSPPRPILIHLTPDSSWLLSLPIPNAATSPNSTSSSTTDSPNPKPDSNSSSHPPKEKESRKRTHYNILIDPWLSGPQIDFNLLFSRQTHATEAAVPMIAGLEELLVELEDASTNTTKPPSSSSPGSSASHPESHTPPPAGEPASRYESSIDAIVLSHEFTDHTHHDTLIQCSPSVPVYATTKAAAIVRGWGHFEWVGEVVEFPLTVSQSQAGLGGHTPGEWKVDGNGEGEGVDVEGTREEDVEGKEGAQQNTIDWRAVTHPPDTSTPLPAWLGIARLVEERRHDIVGTRLHSAIMIVFDLSSHSDSKQGHAESLIYTPHGIPSTSSIISLLSPKIVSSSPSQPTLSPPITPLILLHGLHSVTISGARINLGGHNGAALARALKVKYWIRTHDEVKDGRGLVGWLLKRRRVGWGEALGVGSAEGKGKEEVRGNGEGERKGEGAGQRETECREGQEEEGWERGEDADGVVLTHSENDEEKVEFFDIGNGECRILT